MKILIAADGSASTPRIADYLAAHDDVFGARHGYHLLHVVAAIPHRAAAHASTATVQRLYQEDGEAALREIVPLFERRGLRVQAQWALGAPAETIARDAERGHCDLLVMGSRGHGALASAVLGSVANEVLARSRIPVLLVR